MKNIRMIVSYDGTRYNGFQTQPGKNTIQDHLENTIYMLTGEQVKITSSGRTDAGVHARGQVINFATDSFILPDSWALAMNARLPGDIIIKKAEEAPFDFHARRHAKRKTYCYQIRNSRHPDVFTKHFEFHRYGNLNIEAMQHALSMITGTHDFTAFCSIRSQKASHVRTIFDSRLESLVNEDRYCDEGRTLRIYITGNGFLYNMVRIIVGTVLKIGEGKMREETMKEILRSQKRSNAGPTAPAHGLTLWNVEYT